MLFGFGLNAVALVLAVVAALGLTTDGGQLKRFAWVRGSGAVAGCLHGCPIETYIGVELRLDTIHCLGPAQVIDMVGSPSCTTSAEQMGFVAEQDAPDRLSREVEWSDEDACTRSDDRSMKDLCAECRDSMVSKSSVILSVLTAFPTMATNLQRSTPFGDVNCQKAMGMLMNLVGMLTSLIALLAFRRACYANLPEGKDGLGAIEWTLGPGFRCLMAATLIKFPDAICHFLVPVPKPKWTKPAEKLNLAQYMSLGETVRDSADDLQARSREDAGKTGSARTGPGEQGHCRDGEDVDRADGDEMDLVVDSGSSPLPGQMLQGSDGMGDNSEHGRAAGEHGKDMADNDEAIKTEKAAKNACADAFDEEAQAVGHS